MVASPSSGGPPVIAPPSSRTAGPTHTCLAAASRALPEGSPALLCGGACLWASHAGVEPVCTRTDTRKAHGPDDNQTRQNLVRCSPATGEQFSCQASSGQSGQMDRPLGPQVCQEPMPIHGFCAILSGWQRWIMVRRMTWLTCQCMAPIHTNLWQTKTSVVVIQSSGYMHACGLFCGFGGIFCHGVVHGR